MAVFIDGDNREWVSADALDHAISEADTLRKQRDEAVAALDEIAARPTSERNPDGDEQAAHAMALLAREHAKRIRSIQREEGQ